MFAAVHQAFFPRDKSSFVTGDTPVVRTHGGHECTYRKGEPAFVSSMETTVLGANAPSTWSGVLVPRGQLNELVRHGVAQPACNRGQILDNVAAKLGHVSHADSPALRRPSAKCWRSVTEANGRMPSVEAFMRSGAGLTFSRARPASSYRPS